MQINLRAYMKIKKVIDSCKNYEQKLITLKWIRGLVKVGALDELDGKIFEDYLM